MTVQRYTYFAQVAEIEGFPEAARLFTELAESAACAAHGHLDFLRHAADPVTEQPIGDTRLNLAAAMAAELREAREFYPTLVEVAFADAHADTASWLKTMAALKASHTTRLDRLLAGPTGDPPTEDEPEVPTDGG
jgi:rubrerythrin